MMSRTPGTPRSSVSRALAGWLLAWLICAPPYLPAALAGPEGEQVVHGEVSVSRPDANMTVIHASDGAIIQYKGFDILGHETVQFVQPNEQSRVLNRVFGDATHIDGTLLANGIVYIVNPSGIFYGGEAIVRVGELVSIGGTLGNEDFLNGVERYDLLGPVENNGTIEATRVSLLGSRVANHGSIIAPNGVIALVAGDRVVLAQLEGGIHVVVDGPGDTSGPGIVQAGLVDAGSGAVQFSVGDHYSLALNHTGMTRARVIEARAGDEGVVQVSGTLDASAREAGGTGGQIRVLGDRVALVGATLDASGDAGGGAIRVGGDLRGKGPLPNARRTLVDATSVLVADAITSGDGGSAVLFSEEATGFAGEISARGGAQGGDGGFVELSSNGLLVDEGRVDLRAPAGHAGTLLYDPQDIVITGGTEDGTDAPNTLNDLLSANSVGSVLFGDVGTGDMPFVIYESEIEGTDANIVLEARNSIQTAGTFDHIAGSEGAGVVVVQADNDLTMSTANDSDDASGSPFAGNPGIVLTGSAHGANLEFQTSGDGTILLETGTANETGSPEARIDVGRLRTAGGNVDLISADGSMQVGRIETTGADAADDGVDAGDIRFDAGDQDGSNDTSVLVTGDLIAHGGNGGTGTGGAGGVVALRTRAGSPATTGGGDITVTGNIDASGGNGPEGGGSGNLVFLQSAVQGDVTTGNITTRGGNTIDTEATGEGGSGGNVDIETANGDVSVGAIVTSGGDTDGSNPTPGPENVEDDDLGGFAGGIGIDAGTAAKNPSGSILLRGTLVARGGAGVMPDEDAGIELGGRVILNAADAIEHDGDAGAHIATSSDVALEATDIGAMNPLRIDASGDEVDSTLAVTSPGDANVDVIELGFREIQVVSRSADSDIDITQTGDVVRVDGDAIGAIDTTTVNTDVRVLLQDELNLAADVDLDLTVPTGSTRVGGLLELRSEDDLVIGTGAGVAIEARLDPNTEDEEAELDATAANIVLAANADGVNQDGTLTGAIRSGDGSIDRSGGGSAPGTLILTAAQGIGTLAEPLLMQSGGRLQAENIKSGGIHLRNSNDGELIVGLLPPPLFPTFPMPGVRVNEGAGGISIENTGGGVTLERQVLTPGDLDDNGGDVRVAATGGVTLDFQSNLPAVDANGDLEVEGNVILAEDSQLVSREGDVAILGAIDTQAALGDRVRSLVVSARLPNQAEEVEAGLVRLDGDVGVASDLRNFTVNGDLALTGDENIEVTNNFAVSGDTFARNGDDTASLSIVAGPSVSFGGNVGEAGRRFTSVSVGVNTTPPPPPFPQVLPSPTVAFTGQSAQQVVAGAGGIAINPAGLPAVPETASVWKNTGDLTLTSAGPVNFGQNVKLTVPGRVELSGSSVQIGDVNAPQLHVTSSDIRVWARDPGNVLLKNGELTADRGTDIIANVVNFSSSPVIVGTGNTPQIASSDVTNAGPLLVTGFSNRIGPGRLFRGETALDLTILPADPGWETPLLGPPIEGLEPLRASRESAAGSALAPSAEEVLAWLRCGAERRDDCPAAPDGSPLDSPRGEELEQLAAALLGSSSEAEAVRDELARLDPEALRQLAVLLTEVRLLGLDENEYATVRDALFEQLRASAGAQPQDPNALAQGVRGQARGVPL